MSDASFSQLEPAVDDNGASAEYDDLPVSSCFAAREAYVRERAEPPCIFAWAGFGFRGFILSCGISRQTAIVCAQAYHGARSGF
jgi:hypothetical protein